MNIRTDFLAELFNAAIRAADPVEALRNALPARPKGRTVVIGAGKGAAQLGAAFEDLWGAPVEGITGAGTAHVAEAVRRAGAAAHEVGGVGGDGGGEGRR